MSDKTWRDLLAAEMQRRGDLGPFISAPFRDAVFDIDAHDHCDARWIAWTTARVYFPCDYDTVWVDSVPRHPCDERTNVSADGHR
jgi:hypothetical protein